MSEIDIQLIIITNLIEHHLKDLPHFFLIVANRHMEHRFDISFDTHPVKDFSKTRIRLFYLFPRIEPHIIILIPIVSKGFIGNEDSYCICFFP